MASENKINEVEISCRGIDLLVNNDWEGCEQLYNQYKDHSPLLNYCYSFISYMKAVMTFEEPLLDKAQKDIEYTQKICSESTKVFSSIKKAFGLSSSSLSSASNNNSTSSQLNQQQNKETLSKEQILEEKFTKAIILADCKLYLAMLIFIRQEVSGYLSSGLLQIRKSWKMYSKIQKQLYDIYKKLEPNAEQIYGSDPNSNQIQLILDDSETSNEPNDAANDSKSSKSSSNDNELVITDEETSEVGLSFETVKRLLGAVSFGYGLFQISLSFAPPNALKLIKLFGFEGDRSVALKAINFTSISKDMRAPFADMVIIWYSAIAVPLFCLKSESDVYISEEDTRLMLEKNLNKYPKSSLFLYLKGKYYRSLRKDLTESLKCYEQARENSKHIREIQFISIYEIGWLELQNLNYSKALEQFVILHKESRWSRSFSTYICAILTGAMGNFSQANQYIKEALKIMSSQSNKKPNPIEAFGLKRSEYFKKNAINSKAVCELLVVELLYLWVCIPFCDQTHLSKILEICDQITDKNYMHLKCLFEGVVHMNSNNAEFGEQCISESLARAENSKLSFGKYVLPCAHYELSTYYTDQKDLPTAKDHLGKARDNYKDYELENRIQTQIKSLQKRIKLLQDAPMLKARAEQDAELLAKKQNETKNFYLN